MLVIHRAERADALVAALGDVLREPPDDPFAPEIVAVPSKGVERWLAQRLSHVLGAENDDGVCANVLFPSYARLLDETVAEADPAYADAVELWSAERSVWPLLGVIDQCAPSEPWCRVLSAHLGLDGTGDKGRRFAVARKLARLFDRYGRARPELILAWRQGADEVPADLTWQAELWRRLRAEIGTPSPAELLDTACAKIGVGPRFSIFGATRISPARIRILRALSGHRDVHLWLHHPSPALWSAVAEADEHPGPRREQRPLVRHSLLASMSRDVRELQQLLQPIPYEDHHHPIPTRPDTLLGRLQDELAHDRVPVEKVAIADGDDSVRVHAAHGPARQVEIAREAILALLANDETLEPRDILIMCPDVEAYAPLVAASFGMEPEAHPAAQLRVKLADRSLRQTNPLLGLLSQLLELAAGRVTATQLLDLAGATPVRRLFGFDADDIERLRGWTVTAGARWGLDAQHRDAYGLASISAGTWRAALDRLLLGVAMEDDAAWVGNTLPLDDVDSGDIDRAGRFAELVDRIDNIVRACADKHTVPVWMRLLAHATLDLGEPEYAWQAIQVRRELDDVAEEAGDTDVELDLADVAALLQTKLAGRPTRASFRTGTLTVCTLVPMRSVPHRVVCLLGMDDGAFPRQSIADGDDVLARDPRTGERDIRSEDRQLFLDAICAAQEHLVITYTGADPRTGADVPPCVPLGELLDAIDATAVDGRDRVVVHHPLQPFDRRNFQSGVLRPDAPFSFDPLALTGARAAAGMRSPAPALVASRLPLAPPQDVGLDELIRFFQHPVRGFLRQRLEISTYVGDEDADDGLPVELDGLQDWAVGDRALRRWLAGTPRETVRLLERLRGDLPPGPLGDAKLERIGRRIVALLDACTDERQHDATSVDVNVRLADGRVLSGTVPGVRDNAILAVGYSTLAPKHRITAWLHYLALVASTGESSWRAVTVGRRQEIARRETWFGVEPALAHRVLGDLVRMRDTGLREPLPLALATSALYAERRHRGEVIADVLPATRTKWENDTFGPERDEPEHALAFGPKLPFEAMLAERPRDGEEFPGETTRFGVLARMLWDPLFMVEGMNR